MADHVSLSTSLRGRRVTVGVAGGIAAYKAAELVRLFVKEGATVQVLMTRAAEQFVGRLTLQSLSGRKVPEGLFDLDDEAQIGHIRLADETDILVIAPATADLIARLAAGLADDLLATVALATRAPILLAPAMNVNMWNHPATRANLRTLVGRGVRTVGPDAGELACGWVGAGRMVEPLAVAAATARVLDESQPERRDLEGVPLIVTAGPTHEPLDPVRFVGNRSSGKMGFALARRAAARGARVTLVAGPVSLPTPTDPRWTIERVDVETARQMREAVLAREADARCVIMAAAVADFRPRAEATEKIKKGDDPTLTIVLEKNPDILAELGARRRARGTAAPLLVGFAAETGGLVTKAEEKLARKGCDLLVGNDVAEAGSGFGTETNRVVIFAPGSPPDPLPLLPKEEVADRILDRVAARLGR